MLMCLQATTSNQQAHGCDSSDVLDHTHLHKVQSQEYINYSFKLQMHLSPSDVLAELHHLAVWLEHRSVCVNLESHAPSSGAALDTHVTAARAQKYPDIHNNIYINHI